MSQADVSYRDSSLPLRNNAFFDSTTLCGSCGYPLNLSSSNQCTSTIGSEYHKSIKKGVISFLSVDFSRFTQVDEVSFLPLSWGPYRSKTKLLCRKCGALIGYGYGESATVCGFDSTAPPSSCHKKYTLKVCALQPSEENQLTE